MHGVHGPLGLVEEAEPWTCTPGDIPEPRREGRCRKLCSLSSYQRYQLSKPDKTISSAARQSLNKDELPGESCSRGSLDIVPFITINTMGSAGITLANKAPGTSFWAPLALQPGGG